MSAKPAVRSDQLRLSTVADPKLCCRKTQMYVKVYVVITKDVQKITSSILDLYCIA